MWIWPLLTPALTWPDAPGQFAAVRKHDIHTGVDLYTEPMTAVVAVETGTVVGIEPFTGAQADSPWWNDTQVVLVEGPSGVVAYGEIAPLPGLQLGQVVEQGMRLGQVLTVLRHDKGRPMTMLHLELYNEDTRTTVWWRPEDPKPANLRDPTPFLEQAFYAQELRVILRRWRENELLRMTKKVRDQQPQLNVETDEFVRMAWALVHSFAGAHHVPKVKFGARWMRLSHYGDLATTDGNVLTRLVVACHDAALRLSLGPGGPRQVILSLHPRARTQRIMTNHPTLEVAAQGLRERWAPCPVHIPMGEPDQR